MQINIHEALAKIKLYDKKIESKIFDAEFITYGKTKDSKDVKGRNKKNFIKKSKEDLQSITDMIKERNKIKNAIILSNANTKIIVANVEYTVAEAIELKNSIELKRILLDKLIEQNSSSITKVEKGNEKVSKDAFELTKKILEADAPDEQKNEYVNSYKMNNELSVVEGIDIEDKIKELKDFIDNFESEVDFRLSASNAVTVIEI